jgi:glycosyltransferase involved in cell wall biosynthesis
MRIIQIVPHISNEASGPSYSVVRLPQSIALLDNDVLLMSVSDVHLPDNGHFSHLVFPKAAFPPKLCRSPQLYNELGRKSMNADIVHSHSLWELPTVYPGWVTKGNSSNLVISPRGTLSIWALSRSALRKRVFWKIIQEPSMRHASCFHATAECEYDDIRRAGFRQPICIIPNGVDVPELVSKPSSKIRTLLFLGRLHPIKGVNILLHAWHAVMGRFPGWQLRIVGPDNDGYLAEMRSLAAELNLMRVEFAGALFGEDKLHAYRTADLFVLPTHSENFGMTVAEALAAGTPAIVSKGAPWSGLVATGAGWWIDIGKDSLVACLEEALLSSTSDLTKMGLRGRNWMKRDYSWDHVGQRMADTYKWILHGGNKPEWVIEE